MSKEPIFFCGYMEKTLYFCTAKHEINFIFNVE